MPNYRRTIPILLIALLACLLIGPRHAQAAPRPQIEIFVDTDIGVDDAVAIAWLLKNRSANVIGFTTVTGNATAENATQNLLTLLDVAHRQEIPVTVGASAPLELPASHIGAFTHGPSGLWFSQVPHDISGLPHDAPKAIADAAVAHSGMTLLALGPLTNVALAAQRYPSAMANVRVVSLAGSLGPGNSTPVSEFNAYFDPKALDIALESHLNVTLVTHDAFKQMTVDSAEFAQQLNEDGGALGQLLASALAPYFASVTQGAGGPAQIPDVVAAIYAVRPELGTPTSGLVDVATADGLTRGLTVIATTTNAKVTMIASDAEMSALVDRLFSEPGFNLFAALIEILMRRPDNAQVVLDVKDKQMANILTRDLTHR
jgi:inosine-uridine nucleoside N-ribohydrolase